MSWVLVSRWIKKENEADIRKAAEAVRSHWENVALDVGLDPAKNVEFQEGSKEVRVYISEEMDALFREEPGEWR